MRFRRRASGRRSGKRTVSWCDGLSTFDTNAAGERRYRTLALSPVVTGSNTWAAAVGLVVPSDLTEHGGEDAVVTRIRGSLNFFRGRIDTGAGLAANSYPLRVLVVQTDSTRAGLVMPFDYTTSEGLGRDDILLEHDVIVASTDPGATGTGWDAISFDSGVRHLEVDVKAKRKVQVDRQIMIWFQAALNGAVVQADFSITGALRTLLMRPR